MNSEAVIEKMLEALKARRLALGYEKVWPEQKGSIWQNKLTGYKLTYTTGVQVSSEQADCATLANAFTGSIVKLGYNRIPIPYIRPLPKLSSPRHSSINRKQTSIFIPQALLDAIGSLNNGDGPTDEQWNDFAGAVVSVVRSGTRGTGITR